MSFRARPILVILALSVIFSAVPVLAQSQAAATASSWLDSNAASAGLTAADVSSKRVSSQVRNPLNGHTHIYYLQQHAGIDVFNAIFSVAVSPAGKVVAPANNFVANLAARVNTTSPVLSAEAGVLKAAEHVGIAPASSLTVKETLGGASQAVVFDGGSMSQTDIRAALMYVRSGGAVRLAWDVTLQPDSNHLWKVKVDAVDGALLHKMNMVVNDSYQVYAWPAESPNHVTGLPVQPADGRTIVNGSVADPTASRYGWHDTNAAPGADTTNTTGNNVAAQTDLPLVPGQTVTDNRLTPVLDVQPSSATREFHYPADLTKNPDAYREAVVTNLFYWNNVIHDVMYLHGFDEASGNFQRNNYTGAGAGADAVIADAQDGSGTNNANFSITPDGTASRMQMFIWIPARGHEVVVNSPASLGTYQASPATFGRQLDATGITGDVVLVDDGAGVTWDFCEPMPIGSLSGKIALAERGTCNFTVKAQNADRAGAAGLIVVNNQGENETLTMGSLTPETDRLILVAAQMVGRRDGLELKANLPANVTMRNVGGNIPRRDSDFDNGVIVHEYGHGISTRLTGGPDVETCLGTPQQGGEGWSDWFALVMTAQAHHTATTPRGIGTYLTFEDDVATSKGIRPYPYTIDKSVNPQTYGDLTKGKLSVPHGVGSVWATTLWDMYWAIVGGVPELGLPGLGFRQNLYDLSAPLAGNQIALRLVLEGLRLQPCDPSFVEARDAILEADRINYGGKHACYIWWAFARRGLGVNADDGGDSLDVSEDFSMPQACTAGACLVSPKFAGAHSVISATDGTARLTVRWDAGVANCGTSVTYNVYRSTEGNFVPADGNRIAANVAGTSYTDSQVAAGVRYYYVVRAVDSLGNVDANLKRRSGVPVGALTESAVFFDDAGDTRPQQFVPTSAVRSWATRTTEGLAQTRAYATSASGNYPNLACMSLESDTIYLGADPDLQFFSSWQIEPAWDGGIVEIATEDGNFGDWTKLNTIQYPGAMGGPEGDPACGNPGLQDGERAFNGASPTFVPFLGSLAEWANRNVRIRFVFGSDPGTELGGWLLDNISVDDVRAAGPTECFEEDSQHIAYSGGWHRLTDADASGGAFRMHTGKSPNHNLVFDFETTEAGGSLAYHYAKSARGGSAEVWVDGVLKGTIGYLGQGPDPKNPEFGFSFLVEGLTAGTHRFELRNMKDAVYLDRFCVTNGSSSALPSVVPGVTDTSTGALGVAQEMLKTVTLPAGAQELTVTAASDSGLPIQLVVLNALGSVVGSADNSGGFATIDLPVSAGGVYAVKVVNLSAGPVNVWTASTPLVRK